MREWVITNGIGGFASSTDMGLNTRRYHGLLIAACNPPGLRKLILSKVDESIELNGKKYDKNWNSNIGKKKNREENARNINHSDSVFGEVINMFFGAKKEEEPKPKKEKGKTPIKGENVETAINVSIEEAFFGVSKKISLRAIDRKNEKLFSKNSSRNKKWWKN